MANCFPEGWGQGLELGDGNQFLQSMTAMQNSISQLAVLTDSVSSREKGPGQGQTPQRAGQGQFIFRRGKEKPEPQTLLRESNANNRRSQMPELPGLQVDHQICVPITWAQTFPRRNSHKTPPTQKKPWPNHCEIGCGWVGEKDTQQKKAESLEKLLAALAADNAIQEDLESRLEQLRASLKDPKNPGARLTQPQQR